jgi:hypothetical protein
MNVARPFTGQIECLPVEEWAVRLRVSPDHFRRIYKGRVLHLGANLRIYAADLHEWLDAQGAEDSNHDPWNGVGETQAVREKERSHAQEGPLRRCAAR